MTFFFPPLFLALLKATLFCRQYKLVEWTVLCNAFPSMRSPMNHHLSPVNWGEMILTFKTALALMYITLIGLSDTRMCSLSWAMYSLSHR